MIAETINSNGQTVRLVKSSYRRNYGYVVYVGNVEGGFADTIGNAYRLYNELAR